MAKRKCRSKQIPAYTVGGAMSGLGQGASLGASVGSIIPIPGATVIGAGVGALAGGIAGWFGSEAAKKKEEQARLEAERQRNQEIRYSQQLANQNASLMNRDNYNTMVAFANGGKLNNGLAAVSDGEVIRQNGILKDMTGIGSKKKKDNILTATTEDFAVLSNKNLIPGSNQTWADAGRAVMDKYLTKKPNKASRLSRETVARNKANANKEFDQILDSQQKYNYITGKGPSTKAVGDTDVAAYANGAGVAGLIGVGGNLLSAIGNRLDLNNERPIRERAMFDYGTTAAAQALANNRYDTSNQLSTLRNQMATNAYNMRQMGTSGGQYQSANLASQQAYNTALGGIYQTANQYNQQNQIQAAQLFGQASMNNMAEQRRVNEDYNQAMANWRTAKQQANNSIMSAVTNAANVAQQYQANQQTERLRNIYMRNQFGSSDMQYYNDGDLKAYEARKQAALSVQPQQPAWPVPGTLPQNYWTNPFTR